MHLGLHRPQLLLNTRVHNSTITQRLNRYGLSGRVARRKPLLSKKNTWLGFAKLDINIPQIRPKVKMLGYKAKFCENSILTKTHYQVQTWRIEDLDL